MLLHAQVSTNNQPGELGIQTKGFLLSTSLLIRQAASYTDCNATAHHLAAAVAAAVPHLCSSPPFLLALLKRRSAAI
jgi:hypothetical protein